VLKLARLLAVVLSSMVILIVLPSGASAETCPNEQLRQENHSTSLPDCRAYEQVTAVEKDGGIFHSIGEYLGVGAEGAPDLVAVSYAAIDGQPDEPSIDGSVYSITRTSSGWVTTPMQLSAGEYLIDPFPRGTGMLDVSLDRRSALWFGRGLSSSHDRLDLLVSRPGGVVEDLGSVVPPGTSGGSPISIVKSLNIEVSGVAASGDLSRVLYQQKSGFWPFDTTEQGRLLQTESLYEMSVADGTTPMLVGVDEAGGLVSNCGTLLGGGEGQPRNAVSTDGETVFFTALHGQGCAGFNELYARIGNGLPGARTVDVSEPVSDDCGACDTEPAVRSAPSYEGASADGSKVFFQTRQPLLGGDTTPNLYEYDFAAPAGQRVVRVSAPAPGVSDSSAEVQGNAVAISEDGSHVYFVAGGVLTNEPNDQGQHANSGAHNLYVFERDDDDQEGRVAFIADLSARDEGLWRGHDAQVTPDGRFLVFSSATENLTPDDTSTVAQVFEYDAETGSLTRVSIGQDGYNDNGNTDVVPASLGQNFDVSDDGSYVFFQSADGLTTGALNRVVIGISVKNLEENPPTGPPIYANNIYEYHDGNVYLISDGRDVSLGETESSAVELVGGSPSGSDVLFTTVDRLAPTDIDTATDIYDARIGGGFPAPPSPPQPCAGDGCQGPLSPSPVLLSPGSEFQAPGNPLLAGGVSNSPATPKPKVKAKPKPKKCRKGTKLRRGRCVTTKAKKADDKRRPGR
jgi:Tol biopolymer transport system component